MFRKQIAIVLSAAALSLSAVAANAPGFAPTCAEKNLDRLPYCKRNASEIDATPARGSMERMKSIPAALLSIAALAACFAGPARADPDPSTTVVLVAKPELRADPVFGSAILVATSIGGGQHAGFIVNRPTTGTLGRVFPEK